MLNFLKKSSEITVEDLREATKRGLEYLLVNNKYSVDNFEKENKSAVKLILRYAKKHAERTGKDHYKANYVDFSQSNYHRFFGKKTLIMYKQNFQENIKPLLESKGLAVEDLGDLFKIVW